ncbi:MAG TPA: peptidylprolyl isomerase [Chthoniobacterales bacterium]|jgi:cyclophilin family peptidyl-prolyl cis-trans isomerase
MIKRLIALAVTLIVTSSVLSAKDVAVFEVQWKEGKVRQTRSFAIAFDEEAAPYTVYNFKKLVKEKFYVKTKIHRAISNYLIQGGDPLTKKNDRNIMGTGGPGYTLPAEIRLKHVRGAVAMGALSVKVNPKLESNGSQFYICLKDIPSQDGKDTVFGHVAGGMDALMEISAAVVDTNNNPINPIVVTKTYLIDEKKLGAAASKF